MTPEEVRAALGGISEARHRTAADMAAPLWRHVAYGLLLGTMTLVGTLAPYLIGLPLIALFLIMRWDRKHYGAFINGFREGRTQKITWFNLILVSLVLLFAVAGYRGEWFGIPVVFLLAGFNVFASTLFSIWWERTFIAELEKAL